MTFKTVYEVKANKVYYPTDDNTDHDKYVFVKRTSTDGVFEEYGILYVHPAYTQTGVKKTVVYEFCPYSSDKLKMKETFYDILKYEKIDVVDKEYMDKCISNC